MRRDLTTRSIILEMKDGFQIGRFWTALKQRRDDRFIESGIKLTGSEGGVDIIVDDCGSK